MDIVNYNRIAWDKKVDEQVTYTKSVSKEVIEKAKSGDWKITVTAGKPVPESWFPTSLEGLRILCLASGGGQQGPVLAAAGAEVTVTDISKKQLEQDEFVAKRDELDLKTIQCDMADLSRFADEAFDMVVNPVSNLFVQDVRPVWKEIYRVLKYKGVLISGFVNPLLFIFDDEEDRKGNLLVKNSIPSSSIDHLTEEGIAEYIKSNQTIEFGHTLEDQIQGQFDTGFMMHGFFEDDFGGSRPLDKYIKSLIAARAVKINID
jgi:ubiquinone/menaquinone biosynthesis C-methylase UbiE